MVLFVLDFRYCHLLLVVLAVVIQYRTIPNNDNTENLYYRTIPHNDNTENLMISTESTNIIHNIG